jgi:ribosomal protein L20A (L18A)
LVDNPKILDISEIEVEKVTKPYLKSILMEQKIRQDFQNVAK